MRACLWFCICAKDSGMGLSPDACFQVGFWYTGWLWGFDLYIWESIVNAGMRDSFGIVQLSGKLGEKRKYCKISRKEL